MRPDARQQFLNAERLGHIVVGACVKRLHLRSFVLANRQNQHRRCATRTDGPADFDAAHGGHHQVRDHQVRRPVAEKAQALLGIVGGANIVSLRGKCGAQHPRNLGLVVNNQNSSRHFLLLSPSEAYNIPDTAFRKLPRAGMIPVEKSMGAHAYARQALRWLAASATAALATFVLAWLGANSTTAGMVFLVLVVWWAAQAGIVLSIYTAVLCALCFDYYFLPPVHTLRLEGAQAWVAMVSFALSCVVVSRLSERARQKTVQAEQRQADVGKLYALSQEMMLFEDADRLLHDLPGSIDRIFALEGVVLYVADQDRFLLLDRRASRQRPGSHAGRDAGSESHYRGVCRLPDHGACPGVEARRRAGLAAGYAVARSRHCGERAGIHRRGTIHRHGGCNAHRGGARSRPASHRSHRLADTRVAHAAHFHPRRGHHTAGDRGAGRSRTPGDGASHQRGGGATGSVDRRGRGDGRDRCQRGSGQDVVAASARIARSGCRGIAQDSGLAQGDDPA